MPSDFLRYLSYALGPIGGISRAVGNVKKALPSLNSNNGFAQNLLSFVGSSLGSSAAQDVYNKYTGAGLTTAERESIEQQRYLRQTQYQDFVSGMQDAGLNPAMMYGSGVSASTPSLSFPSQQGMSFSDLMQLALLPAQIKNLTAATKNTEAATEKTKSEIVGQNISNDFAALLNQSALDSQSVSRELSRHQIHEVDSKIDFMEQNRQNLIVDMQKSIKEMSVMDAQISRIDTQNLESMADILLKRASASRLIALLPYEQLYMSAKTDAERGAAAASFAQAAWQNGLIDTGYIDTTCKALEITNSINEVKAALTNPNYQYDSLVLDKAGRAIMATISALLNPLKGIVSF